MNKPLIFLIMVVLLVASVPWFYNELELRHIFGFPPWAMYSFIMVIVFAVVTCVIYGLYWFKLAEGVEEIDENSEGDQ